MEAQSGSDHITPKGGNSPLQPLDPSKLQQQVQEQQPSRPQSQHTSAPHTPAQAQQPATPSTSMPPPQSPMASPAAPGPYTPHAQPPASPYHQRHSPAYAQHSPAGYTHSHPHTPTQQCPPSTGAYAQQWQTSPRYPSGSPVRHGSPSPYVNQHATYPRQYTPAQQQQYPQAYPPPTNAGYYQQRGTYYGPPAYAAGPRSPRSSQPAHYGSPPVQRNAAPAMMQQRAQYAYNSPPHYPGGTSMRAPVQYPPQYPPPTPQQQYTGARPPGYYEQRCAYPQQQQAAPVQQKPVQHPTQYYAHHPSVNVAGGDLCLVGCIFYPADPIDNDWVTTITLNGGVVDYTYGARTTHVIVESMRHQCVHQAIKEHKRCITAKWLNDCIGQRRMTPPTKIVHLPRFYDERGSMPCVNKLFACAGFDQSEQQCIRLMVESVGGRLTDYLSQQHDFLIVKSPGSPKFGKAVEWRIPTVSVQWLTELCAGSMQPLHYVNDPMYRRFETSPHTDVLNVHPSVFERFAEIYTHLLSAWREPIIVSTEVYEHARSTRQHMEMNDARLVPSLQIKLSPAPEEEEILVKTQQMPAIEGEMGRQPRIIFSGFLEEEVSNLSRKARWLGAEIAQSVIDCTHLVCKNLERTRKLLEAVALGKYVMLASWIDESFEKKEFVDTIDSIARDEENEIKFGYNLRHSLVTARHKPLFEDTVFYVTPSVRPSLGLILDLVRIAGGRIMNQMPSVEKIGAMYAQNKRFIIVAHEDDYILVAHAMHAGVPVQNTEFVLTGILRQQIDYDQFALTPPSSTQQHDVRQVYQQQQLMYAQHTQHVMHR